MRSIFYVMLSLVSISLFFVSCNDDENGGNSNVSITPSVDVQMRVGSENLTEGNTYTINGTKIQVDVASFYLGNISLSGTETSEQDDYYVINSSNKSVTLDAVTEGDYDFSFGIGIDAETNSQTTEDFTTRAEGDPLGLQEPSMHWNWNSGYKFLRVDGMVDTDADDVVDTAVQYHIGSDAYFATLDSPQAVNLTEASSGITIRFDLAALLDGIDISTGEQTHVGDNKPMADSILENYTSAFSVIF